MKNKAYLGLAAIVALIVLFVGIEFRRRALTVLCPALLVVGIFWAIALVFKSKRDANWIGQLIASGVLTVCGIIAMFIGFDVVEVTASDVGVLETWEDGVQPEPLMSRTYIAFPNERIYIHSLGQKLLEIGTNHQHGEYKVQSSDNQDMFFTLRVQWRRLPDSIATLHKRMKPGNTPEETDRSLEEKFIVPFVLRTVNDKATIQEAIKVYSGEGRVKLHEDILQALHDANGGLYKDGIFIDDCVIEQIRLDSAYVDNIQARQVAMVKESRARQEKLAADAEAEKAKAEAMIEQNRRTTEADTKKQEAVTAAKGENEKRILEAEAEAKRTTLAAEAEAKKVQVAAQAEAEAGVLKAKAIAAIGQAEAEAAKLKYAAYAAPGAEQFVKIEVAKSMADAFGNIKGYLPESMSVFTLGQSFTKAIESIADPGKVAK